jgi:phosphoglycolate phosphatase
MKQENLSPQEVVMVGDSVIDIETCRNAGVEAAIVTHGFESRDTLQSHAPGVLADSFDELLAIAKQKGW